MSIDVGRQAVRGVAWLGGGQLLRQVIGFVTTITLARLLAPDDFGLFAMTFVAVEFAQLFTDFGFGAAIVQRQVSSERLLNACFWINVVIAAVIGGVIVAAAPVMGAYFGRVELSALMLPLAFNVVLAAAMTVPQALLAMRLGFRQIILAQTVGSVVASIVTLTAAANGLGYWSLAMQPLVGNAVTLAVMLRYSAWRPRWSFDFSEVRGLLDFSGFVMAANIVGFVARSMPIFIVGRVLGSGPLALFGLAGSITGTVLYQISSVIVRVLFPTLSLIKDEPLRLRSAWSKANAGIAALALPIMAGVAAVPSDFVVVVLGAQWVEAAGPLRYLCLGMAVQSVLTTSGTVLLAKGRARALFALSCLSALGYALGLGLGVQFSLTAAAVGYMASSIALNLLTTLLACRASQVPFLALIADLVPWAAGATIAAGAMLAVSALFPEWQPLPRLGAAAGVGALVYACFVLLAVRARAMALWDDIAARLRR